MTVDASSWPPDARRAAALGRLFRRIGRAVALAGVCLPLVLIGISKFTQSEIEGVEPLLTGTPWLAWLPALLGAAGASYLLGVVEVATAVLFLAGLRWPLAGVAAGAFGAATFAVTVSILLAQPIWDTESGGFPWLNSLGQFIIKDVALLGISLVVLGEGLLRTGAERRGP
ncbi:DUF417 family protein [Chelatococcus reniformis]|uniref:DUF417 family protein n=1 Tax=Chelatococcus reniformis TaxID=1494448 RepID=A0A916XD47_9HYPH|nr:DUF417 family protein [Chelatococcus reniformis]GGC61827.1 hypothetical protein GCM10010994_20550 [Chelatococcus reniformis]